VLPCYDAAVIPEPAAFMSVSTATQPAISDPETLGWMQGFPPAPNRTITFQDGSFRSFPELRWAWSNIRQLVPTVNVSRGGRLASPLPRAEQDIGTVASTMMERASRDVREGAGGDLCGRYRWAS
jgi:hypothetical protein